MKSFFFKLFLLIAVLVVSGTNSFAQYEWTRHPNNPVISGSGNGTWDKHVLFPMVLFNADSNRYEMWYCGEAEIGNPRSIGFAWSADGINWTKYSSNPVLTPGAAGSWDAGSVELGWILLENGQYKLWYYGKSNTTHQIGYATSPDGINWTKYDSNPVFSGGSESWEAGGVLWCSVLENTGNYKMYYTGTDVSNTNYMIGRATSGDGINWQRDTINNPILSIGSSGEWDDMAVAGPQILYTTDMLYFWYTGWTNNYAGKIGLATSTDDGNNWTKYQNNPVIDNGSPGSWDEDYVEAGSVIIVQDSLLYMWYDGSRDNTATNLWRIGLATSALVVSVEQEINQPKEFLLSQNFPNPFNPGTTIKYQLPKSGMVTIKVYDVLGNEIATLVNEEKPAGTYELTWYAEQLPSGVYFYQLKATPNGGQAGNFVETKKMILLK